jgi:hypothetical protein
VFVNIIISPGLTRILRILFLVIFCLGGRYMNRNGLIATIIDIGLSFGDRSRTLAV